MFVDLVLQGLKEMLLWVMVSKIVRTRYNLHCLQQTSSVMQTEELLFNIKHARF